MAEVKLARDHDLTEQLQMKLMIQINLRLHPRLAKLRDVERLPCGKARPVIEAVKADLALSRVMKLGNRVRLIAEADNQLAKRQQACGEEW